MAKFYHFMPNEEIETIVENNSDKDFKHKQKSNKSNEKSSSKPITDKKKRREEKVRKRLENETFDSHIKSYSVRKAPLYNNTVKLEAPDGELLSICDKSKAEWYVRRGLGKLIEDTDSCFRVRLNFEPAGRPNSNSEKYYTTEKNNECVVCESTKSLIRKNVVPREYRKHFPTVMKCHVSHDIVLLCLKCHARSNEIDYLKRAELADEFQAPIGNSQRITANLEDRSRKAARSAGNALLRNYDQIPVERRKQLEKVLLDYFGGEEFDMSMVKKGSDLPVTVPRDDGEDDEFLQHGNKVVSTLAERDGINSLKDFEVAWRKHFLDQMKPKFMPEGWDLYHNHERIEEKTQRELDRAQAEIDEVIEYVKIEDFPIVYQIPDGPGLSIHRGNLVDIEADALVISTNETMSHRGGISGAVMRRGGIEYEESLGPIRKETRLRRSTCAYVPGVGKLKCKYVFLTCPSRRDRPTNPDKLDQVYRNVMSKASELGVKTIAFCAIGTGGKGLNQHDAAKCAVETVLECGKSFDKVCFNVFTDISEHAYKNKLSDLTAETRTD